MPRAIYVPVFDSFFEGSIMMENLTTRFVMLALIRLAWRSGAAGEVDVDPRIFAQSINLPLEDVEQAIARLMEPDPASANPDEDGRRIVPINPERPHRGWRLVNWSKYRVMVNRINDAARQREAYHAKKDTSKTSESLADSPDVSESLQIPPGVSEIPENPVTRRDETIRDDTKRNETKENVRTRAFIAPTIEEIQTHATGLGYANFDAEHFHAHHEARGWKLNGRSMVSWKAAVVTWHKNDAAFGRPTGEAQPPAAANPHGIRPSKDRTSMCYRGDWYHPHPDGKRWLTEDDYRPDGTSIMADAGDKRLNEEVYAAMTALANGAAK